jgi:WXG100 family type VII secretion target
MATEPSTFHKIWGTVIDPGGDPDAIRRTAAACRTLSSDVYKLMALLDPVATGLKGHWQGKASDGFQTTWDKFKPALTTYADHMNEAGGKLYRVADAIHEAQIQARNFKIMVCVTLATGAAMTFFTFGASDAAAIAAVEAEAGIMATMLARLGALLAGEAEAVAALISAVQATLARMALGAGLSLAATLGVKGILQGENVLDPANWSAKDATNILLGASLTGIMGGVASVGKISAVLEAHPIVGAGLAGVLGGGSGATIGQVWLNRASLLDLKTWSAIGISAGVAGASGVIIGASASGIGVAASKFGNLLTRLRGDSGALGAPGQLTLFGPNGRPYDAAGNEMPLPRGTLVDANGDPIPLLRPNGQPLFPSRTFPRPGVGAVTTGDGVRGVTGVPAGGIQYYVTYPAATDPLASLAMPPAAPVGPTFPVPRPPHIPPLPAPNPISITAQPGDSLWAIALREYGDGSKYPLIAAANHLSPPYIIQPGQSLTIPPLQPPLPAHASTYVVHGGDSLWAIAHSEYGDGAKYGIIAAANHLSPPYTIDPGQTLTIPALPQPVG